MKERFKGADGKRLLFDAILRQALVACKQPIAEALLAKGKLIEYQLDQPLMEQNSPDNHVCFILMGDVEVWVNKRLIAVRGPRDAIGEMTALDPTAPRSATARARTGVVVWQLHQRDFNQICQKYPAIWKHAALAMADRLRERNKFHRAPNIRPIMFVASSVQGLDVAREIEAGLEHDDIEVRVWTSGVFGPSGITADVLVAEAQQCDFAAFVFGSDDRIAGKMKQIHAPRDNVVFELGLFMSSLGRDRTFIVREKGAELKIPTDLLGITSVEYVGKTGVDLSKLLGPTCTTIRKVIKAKGVK